MFLNKGRLAVLLLITILSFASCNSFLDIVPDNVSTLDNAFSTRHEAEKYLYTCYSYMPKNGDSKSDPGIGSSALEMWIHKSDDRGDLAKIRDGQRVVDPYGAKWKDLFEAIRTCNIFLSNIDGLKDITETERRRWIGEVKFLKAFYNFYLVKMYGPIPLMKKNLPVNTSVDDIQVERDPLDSCFNYIIKLIDKSIPNLPKSILNPEEELGRVTSVIAKSFKAKVMVYRASPLFNGSIDQRGLKNKDGTPLFPQESSSAKWDSAVVACKEAIDACRDAGLKLYYYSPDFSQFNLTDTIRTQMNIRNSVTEKWNSGIIWANSNTFGSTDNFQNSLIPKWDPEHLEARTFGDFAPSIDVVSMFYTEHGLPIDEDKTWDYSGRFHLRTADEEDKLYLKAGSTSASFNFDRGSRFYADLGFDEGVWYGQGHYNDSAYKDLFVLGTKRGQPAGQQAESGYYIKKLIHYQDVISSSNNLTVVSYPFPIMRLSGLYLLYAEALNEANGPSDEVYKYLNLVRERAGLPKVQDAWENYSNNPNKYLNQNGLREIIQQERLIELAFEGQRFWDARRWERGPELLGGDFDGWNKEQDKASGYYHRTVIHHVDFGLKDYFWPIAESTLDNNQNLVQNTGW